MKYNTFYNNYSKSISDLLSSIDTILIDQSVELIKKKIKTNNIPWKLSSINLFAFFTIPTGPANSFVIVLLLMDLIKYANVSL